MSSLDGVLSAADHVETAARRGDRRCDPGGVARVSGLARERTTLRGLRADQLLRRQRALTHRHLVGLHRRPTTLPRRSAPDRLAPLLPLTTWGAPGAPQTPHLVARDAQAKPWRPRHRADAARLRLRREPPARETSSSRERWPRTGSRAPAPCRTRAPRGAPLRRAGGCRYACPGRTRSRRWPRSR